MTEPPILSNLQDDDLQECDWGNCNAPAVAVRLDTEAHWGYDVWLSVCSEHAGEDAP